MADDKLQDDAFNFDDFNFDDLTDDGSINVSDISVDPAEENTPEFSLGDFNIDDILEKDVAGNGGRKEPFFETTDKVMPDSQEFAGETVDEKLQKEDASVSGMATEFDVNDDANEGNLSADALENADGDSFEEMPLTENVADGIVDETGNADVMVPDNVGNSGEETAVEDFQADSVSENFDDFREEGVWDNATQSEQNDEFVADGVSSDAFDANIMTENVGADDAENAAADAGHEAFFAEDAVDEQPIVEEETFSAEEVSGQHEEFFAEDAIEEQPIVEEESFSAEEAAEQHEEFFAAGASEAELQENIPPLEAGSYCGYDDAFSAVSMMEESQKVGFLKWYSGQSDIKMFEISKGFSSGNFTADEECKTLHINVGYDTYGWEIQFSDGVVMNLRDVREYQLRNGRLPNAEGRVVYGGNSLMFSGVERIVVYERVKYFSYGA